MTVYRWFGNCSPYLLIEEDEDNYLTNRYLLYFRTTKALDLSDERWLGNEEYNMKEIRCIILTHVHPGQIQALSNFYGSYRIKIL